MRCNRRDRAVKHLRDADVGESQGESLTVPMEARGHVCPIVSLGKRQCDLNQNLCVDGELGGRVAQLVEQQIFNLWVGGSKPPMVTNVDAAIESQRKRRKRVNKQEKNYEHTAISR